MTAPASSLSAAAPRGREDQPVSRRRFVTRRRIAFGALYWVGWIAGSRRGVATASVARELEIYGIGALRLVCAAAVLVGLIVTFQLAYQLQAYSAVAFGARAVGWFAWRELGPLVVATLVIARSAASLAGELATMSANAEIDALRAMELDPIKYLVAPKLAALLIGVPALTIVADGLITLGAWLGHTVFLGFDTRFFLEQVRTATAIPDLVVGLAKALCFAMVIGVVPAYEGLRADRRVRSIADASSRAVVYALVAVLAMDTVINAVFYFIPGLVS